MRDNLIHVNFKKQEVMENKNLIKATINFLNSIRVHNHELKVENNEILVKKVTDEEWSSMGHVDDIEYIAMYENRCVGVHYKEPEGELDALYINQYGIEA